jgi:hypothetical protein
VFLRFCFGQSRRDEIFIENVVTNESLQPIYGRQKGDVAPKGALEFEPIHRAINISSLRDFNTVSREHCHLIRASSSLSDYSDESGPDTQLPTLCFD